jgi:competence ComEA-like helix-hairpin-helix protein
MNRTAPHIRQAEILLLVLILCLFGWRMLSEFGGPSEITEVAEYRVALNRADWRELMNLPGIGEARAREIVRDRAARGPFTSPEDLTRVHGIGPATVKGIRNYLELE